MLAMNLKSLGGGLFILVAMGALLFLPAWTLNYWQAWTFLTVFGVSELLITLYLIIKDPKLLERRLHGGPTAEKEASQKVIMSIVSIGFVAILVVSALDHRFHWSSVPVPIEIAGDFLVTLVFLIIFIVFKENTFASATIKLVPGQKVISTGPYAVLRHPMYSGSLIYLMGIPIALGSWWGLSVLILMMPVLIWRLFDEEKLLEKNLPGYSEYMDKVKHRLVPFIW
jgi:protein-S-isoprenylcysteine O-methyltransferase Ste14